MAWGGQNFHFILPSYGLRKMSKDDKFYSMEGK
jgi:hypothetical protein